MTNIEPSSSIGMENAFPLHEAASKYDCDKVKSLVNSGQEFLSVDQNGMTVLHALLSNRFHGQLSEVNMVECLKILLPTHKNCVNHKDNYGETPLSLAVSNRFESSAALLVEHGADSSVRTPRYSDKLSLPYTIAKTMPDVMMKIFDSGVTLDYSQNAQSGMMETRVKLNWKPVLQFAADDATGYKHKQKETSFINKTLELSPETKLRLLNHPLVSAFLHFKFNKFLTVKWLRWLQFSLALYPIFYTIFINVLYFNQCNVEEKNDEIDNHETSKTTLTNRSSQVFTTEFPTTEQINTVDEELLCEITFFISAGAYFLAFLWMIFFLRELYMLFRIKWQYINNWRNWVMRATIGITGFTLWPGRLVNVEYNIYWEYPFAALGQFLACVMFLIQLGLIIPKINVYNEMLVSVTKNAIKIVALFIPLLFGFSVGLNILFFKFGGIMDFIFMTVDVGSDKYDEMVESLKHEGWWFTLIAYTFSVSFTILIPVVFMNFLLGVSISDIQELKHDAAVMEWSHRVKTLFILDLFFSPIYNITRGNQICSYTYLPNEASDQLSEDITVKLERILKSKYSLAHSQNIDDSKNKVETPLFPPVCDTREELVHENTAAFNEL